MGVRGAAVRVRIDARRPASWLACGGAAAAAAWIAAAVHPAWQPAAAVLGGAAAAAAAAGALPRGLSAGVALWSVSRSAWPAAGATLVWLVRRTDPALGGVLATMLASGAVTAAAIGVATSAGCRAATASAVSLMLAAVAALGATAVALVAPSPATAAALAAAAASWGLAATVAWTVRTRGRDDSAPRRPRGVAVPRMVMVTALGAMVSCLFLVPHLVAGYLALAGAWLVLDALPRAALGPGPGGDGARRLLTTTAPGAMARPARAAARLVASYAAILAWPPLVAATVAGSAAAAAEPATVAVLIGVGALGLAVATAGALAAGASRETAFAAGLAMALAGVVIGHAARSHTRFRSTPSSGMMLSNPGDPARLPEPRAEPRLRQSHRGVVSCQVPSSSASPRRPV